MARLFEPRQISELISTLAAISPERSVAYLSGQLKVRQFFPIGTWAEKVRASATGSGGVRVPVGVGILDQPGLFSDLDEPKRTRPRTCAGCAISATRSAGALAFRLQHREVRALHLPIRRVLRSTGRRLRGIGKPYLQ